MTRFRCFCVFNVFCVFGWQLLGMFLSTHAKLFASLCRPQLRPRPRERNDIRTHFLFEGSGHALSRLPHQRRLECETEPDYNELAPSRIGGFASQLSAALFGASPSGADDSYLLFWRFPVLSWAEGRLKCTEEPGHHSLLPPPPPLPSFFPATPIPTGHISHQTTNYRALCVETERSDWLCRGCLGGQSCVHFTPCPFGLPPAELLERSHTAGGEGKCVEWRRKEGDKQRRRREFLCTQPSV